MGVIARSQLLDTGWTNRGAHLLMDDGWHRIAPFGAPVGPPVWVSKAMPGDHTWSGVASSGTAIIAVSRDGYIYRSVDDGDNWTLITNPFSGTWADVAYGAGKFVLISGVSTNNAIRTAYSSDDGLSFTTSSGIVGGSKTPTKIIYIPERNVFVLSSVSFYSNALTSFDGGDTWSTPPSDGGTNFSDIAYWPATDRTYGGGARNSSPSNQNLSNTAVPSTGNANREFTTQTGTFIWVGIAAAYDLGVMSVVNDFGRVGTFIIPAAPMTPTNNEYTFVDADATFSAIRYDDKAFIAVANTGDDRIAFSIDGRTWVLQTVTSTDAPDSAWMDITPHADGWVGVASAGTNRFMIGTYS